MQRKEVGNEHDEIMNTMLRDLGHEEDMVRDSRTLFSPYLDWGSPSAVTNFSRLGPKSQSQNSRQYPA